ncbi:MAG: hypothetical protein JNM55_15575 [Anaerolineales bacterium]|nr:hypothetical protein [Anaerolineales bacterium]
MLNLPIAMLEVFLLLTLLFQNPGVTLTSPQSGDVLRGQVEIFGQMDVPNFSSAELAFSFVASDSADTWFTIQTFPQPKTDSLLAVWDTTSVTDGDYTLHLRVYFQDGSSQDAAITDLKIRNDVVLPTETPMEAFSVSTPLIAQPQAVTPLVLPTQTLTFAQPTPLPQNPASLDKDSVYSTFGRGALIALVAFVLISIFLRLRKNT